MLHTAVAWAVKRKMYKISVDWVFCRLDFYSQSVKIIGFPCLRGF